MYFPTRQDHGHSSKGLHRIWFQSLAKDDLVGSILYIVLDPTKSLFPWQLQIEENTSLESLVSF